MANVLPVYEALIDETPNSGFEVNTVSFVDKPAIERSFLAFNKNENKLCFAKVSLKERIVVGPAMIPDQLIYRDNKLGPHNLFFSKSTVKAIAEKFFANDYHKNMNVMHDEGLKIEGMSFFMSMIRDSDKGIIGLQGDYPEGTWFLGAKITSDDLLAKIESGELTGFSVEGFFKYKASAGVEENNKEQEAVEMIETLMASITEENAEEIFVKINLILSGTKD